METEAMIDDLRAASRRLVRELGFMGGDFAGTKLSPSAVHALIEIEREGVAARDLASLLRLEKSSVSRMLRKLVQAGYVAEAIADEDGRAKRLSLTAKGMEQLAEIHAFAREQVSSALSRLEPGQDRVVLDGLSLYAAALAHQQRRERQAPAIEIVSGYQTGLIARITEMHAHYYANYGLGRTFEMLVSGGLADFTARLDNPRNEIWSVRKGPHIYGSIAIDGEDLGDDIAHLRWFIVDDQVRGTGAGRKLLSAALDFVDAHGFKETQLWTFSGLAAARHLYEAHGFVLAEEWIGSQWGKEVTEQRFVRPAKDGA